MECTEWSAPTNNHSGRFGVPLAPLTAAQEEKAPPKRGRVFHRGVRAHYPLTEVFYKSRSVSRTDGALACMSPAPPLGLGDTRYLGSPVRFSANDLRTNSSRQRSCSFVTSAPYPEAAISA